MDGRSNTLTSQEKEKKSKKKCTATMKQLISAKRQFHTCTFFFFAQNVSTQS